MSWTRAFTSTWKIDNGFIFSKHFTLLYISLLNHSLLWLHNYTLICLLCSSAISSYILLNRIIMTDNLWSDNDDESVNSYRISFMLHKSLNVHFSGRRNAVSSAVIPDSLVHSWLVLKKSVLPSVKTCHKSTTEGEIVSSASSGNKDLQVCHE